MLRKTTLFLFLLLPTLTLAQGVRHVNIAQGTTKLASTSGFSGSIMIPIAATITVCTGSTLPAPGNTCTGLASIFVDIGLTGLLSNPTSADVNGNYSFYALGGVPYVVSVSALGFTTFSYVWSAPLSGSSPTLTGTTSVAILNASGLVTASGGLAVTGGVFSTTQQLSSSLSTGTAPFSVASTTQVPNLNVSQLGGLNPPGSAIVGISDTQTLTNKTFTSPTITNPTTTGTDSGTETLTNKTLTSPTLTTPVINGASTGTGVQGTDSKLITSGTVSGTGVGLCTDANGGVTTSGCPATFVLPLFNKKNLSGSVALVANTLTTVDSITVNASGGAAPAFPNSTGPWRVQVCYSYGISAGTGVYGESFVTDGSNSFSLGSLISNAAGGVYSNCGWSTVTYVGNAGVTFTVKAENTGAQTITTTSALTGTASNMSVEIMLSN